MRQVVALADTTSNAPVAAGVRTGRPSQHPGTLTGASPQAPRDSETTPPISRRGKTTPGITKEHTMTNTAASDGHPHPRTEQDQATNSHVGSTRPRRRRHRRVLAIGGTLGLTVLTFLAMLLGGAVVTNQGLHQAVPTNQQVGTRNAYRQAEPAASHGAPRHGRPYVVAFVAGTAGTVASDLLGPYDIFASSPAFSTYVVAAD